MSDPLEKALANISSLPGSLTQFTASLLFNVKRIMFFLVLYMVSTLTSAGLAALTILSRASLALDISSMRLFSKVFVPFLSYTVYQQVFVWPYTPCPQEPWGLCWSCGLAPVWSPAVR